MLPEISVSYVLTGFNRKAFQLFFSPANPSFFTPSYLVQCSQDSLKCTKWWSKTPELAAPAHKHLPDFWSAELWRADSNQRLYSKLLMQHPQPCKSLQVIPAQADRADSRSWSRHPCLMCWKAEAEAVPQNLVISFHLSYHIWEQQESYIGGISIWKPFKIAQYWVMILGDPVSWAGQVNKTISEQTQYRCHWQRTGVCYLWPLLPNAPKYSFPFTQQMASCS